MNVFIIITVHCAGNLVNTYFDYVKGIDTRKSDDRTLVDHLLTMEEVSFLCIFRYLRVFCLSYLVNRKPIFTQMHAIPYKKKNLNFNSRQGGNKRFYSFHHGDEQEMEKKEIRCLAIAFRYSITNNLTHFYINICSVYEWRKEREKAHRNPFWGVTWN